MQQREGGVHMDADEPARHGDPEALRASEARLRFLDALGYCSR